MSVQVGDRVEMKKPHPCGAKRFKVMRVGSDVRIICEGCGRDMTIDRIKLEKAVKQIVHKSGVAKSFYTRSKKACLQGHLCEAVNRAVARSAQGQCPKDLR